MIIFFMELTMYRAWSAFAFTVAIVFACAFVPFGMLVDPANAGEYYDGGYYRRHDTDNDWYSSHCCYRKIVHHERSVHYERVENEARYYRHSYYDRPYYERPYYERSYFDRSYYERPYRSSYYYEKPTRYLDYSYPSRGNSTYRNWNTFIYSRHAENCGRIPLADGSDGWVWSRRAGCF